MLNCRMTRPLFSLSTRAVFNRFNALAAALASALVFAQPLTLNFVDADIDVVAKAVGEITGKTFVLDQRVKGKINIQSSQGVAPSLAYPTFLAALRMAGFAVVESGNIVRIVPEGDAKSLPTPVGNASAGVIATKVLPLMNQSAAQIANAVRPMMSAANINALVVYAPGNALIVTDYSDNIRRIEALIARLDTPSVAPAELIVLNHASALDVVATVGRVFTDVAIASGVADARDRLTITADARSNAVIVRSEDSNRLFRVKALIADLDKPSAAPGNIRIVYLKHADATQVAQTLRRVLGAEGGGAPTPSAAQTQASPFASLLPTNSPGASAQPSALSSAVASLNGAGSAHTFNASGSLPQLSANSQTAFTAGGATVYADTATNSLVISAPTATYNNLRSVIEQLDVRRAQVFIEAVIAEVTADRAAEFGIQWQALEGLNKSNTQGFGGTNFGGQGTNILQLSADPTSAGRGLNLGLVRGAFTFRGVEIANLGLLVRALQNDSSSNVLSTTTLLALDNEEARFSSGQNVPLLTGAFQATGSSNNGNTPFQTIERKDIGLILRVRPLITDAGTIRLQLFQEVSTIGDPIVATQQNIVGTFNINKRVLESTVLADDGQIVVLGGLLQEGLTNGQDKVPVLGDAPLIGGLFRYDTRKRNKTNLMVFLRPTVLRDAVRTGAISVDRYQALGREQMQNEAPPRPMLPPMSNPVLPFAAPASPTPTPTSTPPSPPASGTPAK